MDRFPKKPCKLCGKLGHFPYQCPTKPRKELKRTEIKRSTKPIRKIGKVTQKWIDTRKQWIIDNPPPIEGEYWICYLQIHPWCPVRIDLKHLTLDHVISRTSDPSKRFVHDNLKPACSFCNGMKGSKSLENATK